MLRKIAEASSSHRTGQGILAAALVGLVAAGCGETKDAEPEVVRSAVVVNQTLSQLRIDLPTGTTPGRFAVAAAGSLKVSDRAMVRDSMGRSADASNTGNTQTQVGVNAKVGDLFSQANVDLRNGAVVDGALLTAGTLSRQPGAVVTGTIRTNTSLAPLAVTTWKPVVPSGNGSNLTLQPDKTQTIAPGAYAQVTVNSRSVLHLGAGTYKLGGLDLESGSKLVLDSVAQPTIIYITGNLIYRGQILDAKNANNNDLPLLVVVLGSNAVQVDPVFRGTMFVPNASLSVGPGTHFASFFARDVELRPDTIVELRRFGWTTLVPPTNVSWGDAPVILTASRNNQTGVETPAQKTPAQPVTFTIPDYIYVRTGNAGSGLVEFKFRTPAGTTVTCAYHGGARLAHPDTDLERMRGRRYRFTSCDNGFQLGQTATGTWFSLRVVGGDAQDPSGMTSVALHLGGGCSDVLPAPLAAEEVVAMRNNFSWETIAKLNETDVQGHPALFHGLIYIDSKAQLAALDRLRVFWSAMPISERYMTGLRGKCGRVEHATDGRGAVVYAVFPARLFNVMRDFAIQAIHGNVPPPFKFIIPSPPEQPGFVNTDGSLSYAALGSSRYAEWLSTHPGQLPGWFDDAVDFVTDTASDVWDWTKDKILSPAAHWGEYGFDYVVNGFDFAIDFTANFLDNVWEGIQQGLQEFVLVFSDKINVHLKITMMNRDPLFPPGSPLTRVWGPADATGNRPNLVPAGANVRVRQWGWGFLPVMDQSELGENGEVTLEAVKGASGRGGDLCIEMDTDYAMITTDFIPNEVCDFAEGRYGNYQDNIDDKLDINQADLFGLTQIKDSANYFKTVIGTDTYTFDVLTGWVANEMTQIIAKKHRAMTLCLDFPSTGASAITVAAGALGAAGELAGPVIGAITTGLTLVGGSLIEKDLWWPDADDTGNTRNSRGVMTHEYGHFAMCSLLFAEDGPPGLTGLIARVFEGQDDSRSDEVAQMTETWADNFALQVVGGANYIQTPNSTGGIMSFCTASPCMDQNYVGKGDNSGDPFIDELARFQSLVYDAFDRSDSAQRFTNAVANGDYWRFNATSQLEISPTPYLTNQDERVSLPGTAWRRWVRHWIDRGRKPDHGHVIGGLVQTMAEQGFNWCDRCDLLALHDQTTPLTAYAPNPTLDPAAPTIAQRLSRWNTCTTSPEIKSWLGPPPTPPIKMNASCVACPLHNIVNGAGACQPCPTNSIAPANQCLPCGTIPASTTAEECIIIIG